MSEKTGKVSLPVRIKRLTFISIILIFISLFSAAFAQRPKTRVGPADKSDDKAVELIQKVRENNTSVSKFEGKIKIYRQNGDFLKGILPPMKMGYMNAEGIINYTSQNPWKMRLFLYPVTPKMADFYYMFTTDDGYSIVLLNGYQNFLQESEKEIPGMSTNSNISEAGFPLDAAEIRPDPADSPSPKASSSPDVDAESGGSPLPSPTPTLPVEEFNGFTIPSPDSLFKPYEEDKDKTLRFYKANPINLIFPFEFKKENKDTRKYYAGEGESRGIKCYKVDIKSPVYGKSRIYITKDENYNIIQIDRIDPNNDMVYATAYYSNYKYFYTGGKMYQNVEIVTNYQTILTASLSDLKKIVTTTPVAVISPSPPTGGPRQPEPIFPPLWQMGTVVLVIVLITVLTFFLYRYWFFKMRRKGFAREVIIMEGDRPEEKISQLFTDLDIPNSLFSSEKLTEERARLEKGAKKSPRVVVIGPGMSSQFKSFNFLVRAYVKDGGRAVIFDHGVENVKDMVFTPTFIPFDRNDPNLDFAVVKKWEKIWVNTSQDEIKKRTTAFYPYELLANFEEKDLHADPIIIVTNKKTKIRSAAICLLREGKGEYLIIQYRLLEAMRKLKFTASTAEHMMKDLMGYMFGKEVKMEFAPRWIQNLLGIQPPD